MHELEEVFLELSHFLYRDILKKSACAAVDDCYLILYSHRGILGLYEQTLVLSALVNHACGYSVDVSAKLGERFELTELSLVDLQSARNFLH